MRILYLNYINIESKQFIGVKNKLLGQIRALKNLGNDVSYTFCRENKLIYVDNDNVENILFEFKNSNQKRFKKYNDKLINKIMKDNIEAVYIRYTLLENNFIRFTKKLKKNNIRVFLEIPTYPYDNEISKVKLLIDKIYRINLRKYIDNIIVSSGIYKNIYGVEAIFIDNCVDVKNLELKKREFNENEINIIAVSYIRRSNGYDRIIKGLNNYYKGIDSNDVKRNINITFVGEGKEKDILEKLVMDYNLQERVRFVGSKVGEELNELFNNSDLAIGSLGEHRVGIDIKAPLKSREYCARGIPFISACNDPGFGKEEFILRVPANESIIEFDDIVNYYDKLKNKNISNKMRIYCEKNFTWESQYKKIKEFYRK